FTFVDGVLTINKAALMVTADNTSRAYGAANPTFIASYSGFVNAETLATSGVTGTPGLATAADNMSAAGTTHAITVAVGSLLAGNYDFSFVNGTLTITKAHLTVTANNASRSYGGANPTFTVTLATFVN